MFKVNQLAKDLGMKNKEILAKIENSGINVKSYMATLEPDDFNVFFDELTRENQIKDLDGYLNGFPFNFGETFVICLIIGAIAGIITVLVLKGQLKTVRQQNQANVYVKPGSMQITVHRDLFLYREVSRVKKESNNSSKSGSSRSTGGGSF